MVGTQREPLVRPHGSAYIVDASQQPELRTYSNFKVCKIKRLFVIVGVISAIGLVAWLYVEHTFLELDEYRLVNNLELLPDKNKTNDLRFILFWNAFFNDKRWYLPGDINDPLYFRQDIDCPVVNCVLTNRRDLLPHIEMYDAILFYTARAFPAYNPIPKSRSWKQLYVFALLEPPIETKHVLTGERNFYNLTMTYRMDSDILWTYGSFVDKETKLYMIPSEHTNWREVPKSYNNSNIWLAWNNKTKLAAWFVSHCETSSRREKLVAEIQKYMDVDVFGTCGSKSCPKKSAECDKILDLNYKFFFSFENSLCVDYITEKLYNALQRNVIPVVYGGANYKQFLPPHSYINVEDYKTPQDLVRYLKYLSTNPEEYMRYFWWRQFYEVKEISPFCDLCKRLHQPNYFLKTQFYQDIEKWWLDASCRFRSRIKF